MASRVLLGCVSYIGSRFNPAWCPTQEVSEGTNTSTLSLDSSVQTRKPSGGAAGTSGGGNTLIVCLTVLIV